MNTDQNRSSEKAFWFTLLLVCRAQIVGLVFCSPEEGAGFSVKGWKKKMGRAPWCHLPFSPTGTAHSSHFWGEKRHTNHCENEFLVQHLKNAVYFCQVWNQRGECNNWKDLLYLVKDQILKVLAVRVIWQIFKKKHSMPASEAETGVWDIPCPKYDKTIGLAHSLFLLYFLVV